MWNYRPTNKPVFSSSIRHDWLVAGVSYSFGGKPAFLQRLAVGIPTEIWSGDP